LALDVKTQFRFTTDGLGPIHGGAEKVTRKGAGLTELIVGLLDDGRREPDAVGITAV
jgi:hypothetical protein